MILCIGPLNSGKTLLLRKLQNPDFVDNTTTSVATVGTNISNIKIDTKTYTIRELGGAMAPLWPQYFNKVSKVIYVIDASNLCQIAAAGVLLYTVLVNPLLKDAKVLVLLVALFVMVSARPMPYEDSHSEASGHGLGRVQMKVFRGPSLYDHEHGHFAPWGYWVKQPAGDD